MARISKYTKDSTVEKTDKLIGSNANGTTANFTVEDIARFFRETNFVGNPDQVTYYYDGNQSTGYLDSPSVTNFESSSTRTIRFSIYSYGNTSDTRADFLETFSGRTTLLINVDDPNNFMVAKVTSVSTSGNYKTFTFAAPETGKGSFVSGKVYAFMLHPSSPGDITAVTSATTNQLTVANGTGPEPALTIVTGAIADSGTGLATADQIHTFVTGQTDTIAAATTGNAATATKIASITNSDIVQLTSSQTLTNKTLTSPVFNTGVSGTAIKDEDNMSSDSATHLATQQSIKAYVDTKVTAEDLDFQGDSGGALSIDLDSETLTLAGGTGLTSTGSSNTMTFAVDAAQTGITSILNTSLVTGRDADNQIKYSTDDEIIFRVAGGDDVTMKASGEIEATSLDISGDADIDGTLEADAYTVDGTALNEYIADTVGAMVSSNTETNIAVTYEDGDNTLDFVIGTLNQDTTGTAAIATTITVADESSDTTCFPLFATAATGNLGPKSGSNLTFNSSSGLLTATSFAGALTGDVTGNVSGTAATVTGAAQSNITSLGTLTTLTVDNVIINGTTIGHTGDTDLMTVASGVLTVAGEVDATSLDISGDADIDGTLEADAITVGGTALNTVIAGVTVTNATNSAHVLVTDNESTSENNLITFVEDGTSSTGNVGLEMDGNLTYNPSTGNLTATQLTGTLQTAAQTNITSLGTLTALSTGTITLANDTKIRWSSDDVYIDGTTSTDHIGFAVGGSQTMSLTQAKGLEFIDGVKVVLGTGGDGEIYSSSDDLIIANVTSDEDIIFKGNDGGSTITALTLDMSEAGAATFNNKIVATELDISGNVDIDGTLEADAITVNGSALSSVIAGTTVTLASTITVSDSTANTNFPVVFHDESNALLDDTGALRYNPSTGTLLVPNLNVSGTTTQVNTVTMEAANAVVFEGATSDAYETTLSIVDPTADHTQYLINQGGYIPVLAAATTTAITSTPAELNLLDTAAANTVVNSKAVIYGSSGELAGTLSTAAQGNVTSLGTLTTLTVDNVIINGTTIGHTDDTDLLTLASGALTVAGTIIAAGGSSNNNDDANILTLNASQHARLLVDTSSTSGHRASLVLESNSNELVLGTTGSVSELTSVGALTITSSATTFTGNVISKDTFYLENGSGNRWQMLFDTNAFNLRYYNGSSWSADAFAIDTSNNATFAGTITSGDIIGSGADLTLSHSGGPSVYLRRDDTSTETDNSLGAIYFQSDDPTDGTFNTGPYIEAKAGANWDSSSYPGYLVFNTRDTSGGHTAALTLNKDASATFAGDVTISGGHLGLSGFPRTDLHATWNQMFIGSKGSLISENGSGGIAGMTISDNLYIDSDTGTYAYLTTNEASQLTQEAGVLTFKQAASGTAGNAPTLTSRFVINADGTVLFSGGTVETSGVFAAGNGAVGAPAFTFASDLNTGIYRTGADSIGFATGGSLALTIANNDATFAGQIHVAERIVHTDDTDTYLRWLSDNPHFVVGGVTVLDLQAAETSFTGDTFTFASANSTDPLVNIKNTTNDTNGARLRFTKDKGAAGADGDIIGQIEFVGDNAAQELTDFAKIEGSIETAADGTEGGQLKLGVASHDGEMNYGLVLTDGSAEDEVDATIGNGAASVTTVSGDLSIYNKLTFRHNDNHYIQSGTNNWAFKNNSGTSALLLTTGGAATFGGDVEAPGIYVGSTNTSYDFYNNGTTYLNGATTVDAAFTQSGNAASSFSGGLVVNEGSNDADFRVESNNNAYMIRVDAGNDRVGIATQSPLVPLHVTGKTLIIDETNPAGDGGTDSGGSLVVEGRRDGGANVLTLRARDDNAASSALPDGQGPVMQFQGWDGSDFAKMGAITVTADGQAVANSDAPSAMKFYTTADGSETHTLALTLDKSQNATFEGNVGVGTAPAKPLHISSADNQPLRVESTDAYSGIEIKDNGSSTLPPLISALSDDFIFYGGHGSTRPAIMFMDSSTGSVGIGITSPAGVLDISSGSYSATKPAIMLGGDIDTTGAGTRTDNTRKYSSIVGYHYSNEEQPIGILSYDCQSDSLAYINYGIPSGNYNAPTAHRWWTASNSTTTTGTERMRIDGSGNVGIGLTAPDNKLEIQNDAATSIPLMLTNRNETDNDYTVIGFKNQDPDNDAGYAPVYIGTKATDASERQNSFIVAVSDTDNVDLASDIRLTINNSGNATFAGDVTMSTGLYPDANDGAELGNASLGFSAGHMGELHIDDYIYHKGDTDTYIYFTDNTQTFRTGGSDRFSVSGDVKVLGTTDFHIPTGRKLCLDGGGTTYLTESSDGVIDFYGDGVQLFTTKQNGTQNEVVVNEGSGDVDFRVEANNDTHALFVEAEGSGGVAINHDNTDFHANASNLIVGSGSGNQGITIFSGSSVGNYGSIYFADGRADGMEEYRGMITYEQNNEIMRFHTNSVEALKLDLNQIPTFTNATSSGEAMYIHNTTDSVANTKTLIDFRAQASDNSTFYVSGQMGSKAEGTWTSTSGTRDASLIFNTVLNGTNTLALTLDSNQDATFAGHISVPASSKILFDGMSGHTYIEEESDSNLKVYVAGTEVVNFTNDFSEFQDPIRLPNGSVSAPAVNNTGDTNTGMYWPGDHQLGFAVNGSRKFYMSETQGYFQNLSSGISVSAGGIDVTGDSTITGALTLVEASDHALIINRAANSHAAGILIHNDNDAYCGSIEFKTEYSGTDTNLARVMAGTDGSNGHLYLQVADSSDSFTYDTVLRLAYDNSAHFSGHVTLADSQQLQIGDLSAGDLKLYHDATDSLIVNKTGDLKIMNQDNDKDVIFQSDDGAGGTRTYFFLDGSLAADGGLCYTTFPDNSVACWGDSQDLKISHQSGHSYIENGTGNLAIHTGGAAALTITSAQIATFSARVNMSGNLYITGALSKGSGSFKIDHPLEAKKDTHHLVHSFIEGPQADLIYRGKATLVDGTATVNIDTAAGMTEGTFVALNTDVQCFTSNESDWDAVKGSVSGNTLTITCKNSSSTATISWMVVGERQDQHMKDTDWTDSDGKVIVEPEKPQYNPDGSLK